MKTRLHITLIAALIAAATLFVSRSNGQATLEFEQGLDSIAADSLPYKERLAQRLDSLCSSELFAESQLGLMVYDLNDDSILYAFGEKQTLRPASTLKLLTAVAALDILGKDYRFRTELLYDGECVANVLWGNIYVKGMMNPTLDNADIARMADKIKALEIDTIRGDIIADRSFIDAPPMGRGWSWDDDNPVISPLVFNKRDNLCDVLLREIGDAGIVVDGTITDGSTPADAVLIATRYAPLETVLMRMLKDSDNLCAESVFYNIAAATRRPAAPDEAVANEKKLLRRLGLDPNAYSIADGSGLSPYNFLSAEAEILLLRFAYHDIRIFPALYRSLPVAGESGTLSRRMQGGKAKGNIHAKTGTLTGVSTLAGYCSSPEGHIIAFAILNQGVLKRSRAHAFQDAVCEALCD